MSSSAAEPHRPIDPPERPRLRSVPPVAECVVASASAPQFSESVRQVVALARRRGLRPPVFRSPPRLAGVDRSIRRRPNGTVVVAVRRTDRPLAAVRADVIEGVVAANALVGAAADQFRHSAWALLDGPAPVDPSRHTLGSGPAPRRDHRPKVA